MLRKLSEIPGVLAFSWRAAQGYRLRPWASPYLRWRVETFWGTPAEQLDKASFLSFVSSQKAALWEFLRWAAHMRRDHRG